MSRCSIHVIASEAKQSIAPQAERWIASSPSLLAMTAVKGPRPPKGLRTIPLHLHHALAAVLAGEEPDQRLRRVLDAVDDVFLNLELA